VAADVIIEEVERVSGGYYPPAAAYAQDPRRLPAAVRLGIYADLLYRDDGAAVSTDNAFVLFIAALAERVDELVVFGRLDPRPASAPYGLPQHVRFVALPHYARVTDVAPMLRGLRETARAFARAIEPLELIWIFGPHPIALELVRVAHARHVPVVLGIRQDFPAYIVRRLPSRGWFWAVPAAHLLERTFRLLARRLPTVVVGEDLAFRYRRGNLHVTGISLVRREAVAGTADALGKDWSGELRLLSVGRLDAEKSPLLLPEILASLRRNGAWRLRIAGEGPLAAAVAARAQALGVGDALELRGYVPYGEDLWELYRSSHAFLHVSKTEGLPQVLFEAQAAGLPIVATDVGGVAAALGYGACGLLVPPGDPTAAAEACERLRRDRELRVRLIRDGLELARRETLESQLDRLVPFLESQRRR
jgi:glycosyltransferase involved in cell wall biosynthesis